MRNRLINATLAAVFTMLLFSGVQAVAQPPTEAELRKDIEDITRLDPDIRKYLPRWRILEADLKSKLMLYFRSVGVPVTERDSMTVTASFADPKTGQQDLLTIKVGSYPDGELSGTYKIRSTIGDGLYQSILDRKYAHVVIEPATPVTDNAPERVPNVLNPTNAKQFIALSAFRQAVQLGTSGARLEHIIGNDEIGYHFWSSGQAKVLLDYPIIPLKDAELRANGVPDIFTMQLGIGYRAKFGNPGDEFLSDIISPRMLNGALGAKAYVQAEYRLPQVNDLGFSVNAELPFSKLETGSEEVRADETIVWAPEPRIPRPRPDTVRAAYFLRTVAQGNIFWENWLNDYEHFFRIRLGVSYQEVARGIVRVNDDYLSVDGESLMDENGTVVGAASPANLGNNIQYTGFSHPTEFEDWIFARVEYLNQSGFPFGASAQIANRNLLLTGFIPVIPNWLFLEAKYSTPLLRDNPAPWEHDTFFMISPILRFKID